MLILRHCRTPALQLPCGPHQTGRRLDCTGPSGRRPFTTLSYPADVQATCGPQVRKPEHWGRRRQLEASASRQAHFPTEACANVYRPGSWLTVGNWTEKLHRRIHEWRGIRYSTIEKTLSCVSRITFSLLAPWCHWPDYKRSNRFIANPTIEPEISVDSISPPFPPPRLHMDESAQDRLPNRPSESQVWSANSMGRLWLLCRARRLTTKQALD
ncbi:uncharacterized protein BDZ83DRAFT_246859 [Colletotrichum acutatum]|uniref:Uncharacterized protein n=1 Tax=Glomerella acutata TaxID=27357 RepID=A0AAD8XPV5_GLOAC|nr:uncharacterized protein BDZ83DRAFT_246859 [Colletotrichum acutatum]KAK1731355.1 hypothetical protein BDZ83DRAFT_246859 [Colletotrichum acutatum]